MGNISTAGPNEAIVISGKKLTCLRAIATTWNETVDVVFTTYVTFYEKVAWIPRPVSTSGINKPNLLPCQCSFRIYQRRHHWFYVSFSSSSASAPHRLSSKHSKSNFVPFLRAITLCSACASGFVTWKTGKRSKISIITWRRELPGRTGVLRPAREKGRSSVILP